MLHELVHWALAATPELPHHGSTFARVLVDATAEFCGAERAGELESEYAVQRVRIGAPATCGDDGMLRYGDDERRRLDRSRAP